MRKIKYLVLSLLAIIPIASSLVLLASPIQVSAGIDASTSYGHSAFLGFKRWDYGLVDSEGNIKKPGKTDAAFTKYVWQIVINILDSVFMAIGYIVFGFILYGGFQFITSMGSSDKMAQARTTILNASVGAVIAIASVAIVRTFSDKLFIASNDGTEILNGLLDIFYFATGATAVIVIIISGFRMVTSGDKPDSVAKSRNGIIYASIGLLVVVSAKIITSFILGRF